MPMNVFGSTSGNSEKRISTCLFLGEPDLRTKYIESGIEEDHGVKNQFRIKNLPNLELELKFRIEKSMETIEIEEIYQDYRPIKIMSLIIMN